MAIALLLAVQADKVIRGKRLLPHAADLALCGGAGHRRHAVAVPVQSVLRHARLAAARRWASTGTRCSTAAQAMVLIVAAAVVEADQLQFPVLRRRLAGDPAIADRGRRHRRRRQRAALLDHRLPAAGADDLLPAGGEHGLRALRHLRHHPRGHRRRPGQGDRDAGLQGLQRRLRQPAARLVGGAVGDPDGDRDRADRRSSSATSSGGCIMAECADDDRRERAHQPADGAPAAGARRDHRRLPDLLRLRRLDPHAADDPAPAAAAAARRPSSSTNYCEALFGGVGRIGGVSVGRLLLQHHDRRARRSRSARSSSRSLSAYAIVFFRFPLRMVVLLADLHHADAAGRGAHPADLQGDGRPRPDRHLRRPDPAADRLGDRDAAVPPVLHDHPERAGRGRARRRRRAVALLPGHPAAAVGAPTSRRCSSSSSSTAGPSICGRCW